MVTSSWWGVRGRSVLCSSGNWVVNIWETDSIGWDARKGAREEVREGARDGCLELRGSGI